jgi:hypothetical protein
MKYSLAVALGVACLCVASPSHAGAPVPVPDGVADCAWLKIGVSAKMTDLLAGDAGLGAKHASRAVCYLQLHFTPADPNDPGAPHGRYTGPVLCQNDGNGDWVMSGPDDSFTAIAFPDGNAIGVDNYMTFTNEASDVIQGFGTHVLHITVDQTGAFRSATFQTLTGELLDASTFFLTDLPVIGSYTSHGTTVPAAKVPPGAVLLVTPSMCTN